MASIANTAFEPKVTNIQRNNTQNIAGTFGAVSDGTFTGAICPSGFLTVQYALTDNSGYTGILNGNTWQMVAATNGNSGAEGDHTGIYAFNSYDVPKALNNNGNSWNVGGTTLGLELPANELGTFTEIIIGEQYKFGVGIFSTAPTSGSKYATIANGQLVASATLTAGSGVAFEILRPEGFTLGARYGFDGYVLRALRAPAS